MDIYVYLLLGGLWGSDGIVTSAGMDILADQIRALKIPCETYFWSDFARAKKELRAWTGKRVLIGYSGGGSRATWIAAQAPKPNIDLVVLYDPSPAWQMLPTGDNVKRMLCYYNTSPLMLGLGGGMPKGPNIEIVTVAQQHLAIQFNQALHARTIEEIQKLVAA